ASEVSEVLHEDEGAIRLALVEGAVLDHEAQSARARRRVARVRRAAELSRRSRGLFRVERAARVRVQGRDELRGRERRGVLRGERVAPDEGGGERALARFELLLPAVRADDDAVADGARVEQELFDAARLSGVGRLIQTVDEVARILEFNREEEGRRDVDALRLVALGGRPGTC